MRGDRYILRRPSPGETLGGGVVVDPHPKRRHKRFDEKILQRLEALTQGTPAEVLYQALAFTVRARCRTWSNARTWSPAQLRPRRMSF